MQAFAKPPIPEFLKKDKKFLVPKFTPEQQKLLQSVKDIRVSPTRIGMWKALGWINLHPIAVPATMIGVSLIAALAITRR